MANKSAIHGMIATRYRFPWYMPSKVNDMTVPSTSKTNIDVSWECADSEFIVMFPESNNPIAGGHNVISKGHTANATIDITKLKTLKHPIHYAILLTDPGKEDVVEGANSPPTMIVD